MKTTKTITAVFSFVLAVVLLYVVAARTDLGEISRYLKDIKYIYVIFAVIIYTFDILLRAFRWQLFLGEGGVRTGLVEAFLAYNLGNSLNIIIPARIGDIARSYYLKKKHGYGYSTTLPTVILDRIFDTLGIFLIVLFCSVYVITKIQLAAWFYNLLIAGVIALILVYIVFEIALRKRDLIVKLKSKRLQFFLLKLFDVYDKTVRNKKKLLVFTLYSMLVWLLEGFTAYCVFAALDYYVNPVVIVFTVMVATLTKVIPLTPGGLGVFEGAFVVILTMFGNKSSIIGIISILFHFLMNIYGIVIGIYVLIKENISISKIKMEKVDGR